MYENLFNAVSKNLFVNGPHGSMAVHSGFLNVPTVEDITAGAMETAGHARYLPPVAICTPYEFVQYMVKMMEFRNHPDYPTALDNPVKHAWESNVQAVDYLSHSKLGLEVNSEEHNLIFNMSASLCRRKMLDQLSEQKLQHSKGFGLWNDVLQDGKQYLERYKK